MTEHIEGALFLQLPNGFLDEHLFRVLRVTLAELFPSIWPGLLEVTDQVFRIQGMHLVVLRRLADQPPLIVQGCDDIVLKHSLSAVSHDYSLYPSNRFSTDSCSNAFDVAVYSVPNKLVARLNDLYASTTITDGLTLGEVILQVRRKSRSSETPGVFAILERQFITRAPKVNQLLSKGLPIIREFVSFGTLIFWHFDSKHGL